MKKVLIFGATGSIGQSALQLIQNNPESFELVGVSGHRRVEQLPQGVPILNTKEKPSPEEIQDFIQQAKPNIVLNAVGGFAGLRFSRAVLELGIPLALANKESLVAGGNLLMDLAKQNNTFILPVDSEHSAIFQVLTNDQTPPQYKPFEKIYLTCSGGPFRNIDLNHVAKEQALKHPNWEMGSKITIDSATLANKCLEVFEAMYLFGAKKEQIKMVIHPQSVVHSMVQFSDSSIIAQMSPPDMRLPIGYALNYPDRTDYQLPKLDFSDLTLDFQQPDSEKFKTLQILEYCQEHMGSLPITFNAVNEVAVDAFLKEQISFIEIFDILEKVVLKSNMEAVESFEQIETIDKESRIKTLSLLP